MAAETLLALWNDTPTRRAIVDFVQAVSTEGSPGSRPGEDARLDGRQHEGRLVRGLRQRLRPEA